MKDSILNIQVSCFKNYDTPSNPKQVNLLTWLTSRKHAKKVEQIRAIDDKTERDILKATLPAITPSGLFSYRNTKSLIEHSGFIQFDIDFKHNENISNYEKLKEHIINIANVAYCGLSVSGTGYWGLIPIAYPEKHTHHFEALEEDFKSFGIAIDKACKDVTRLRGYSYDPEGYFNHTAKIYERYKEPPKPKPALHIPRGEILADQQEIYRRLKVWTEKELSFVDGCKHDFMIKLITACNRYGVDESTLIELLKADYLHTSNAPDYESTITKRVRSVYRSYISQHGTESFEISTRNSDSRNGYSRNEVRTSEQLPPGWHYETLNLKTGTVTNLINEYGYPAMWDN